MNTTFPSLPGSSPVSGETGDGAGPEGPPVSLRQRQQLRTRQDLVRAVIGIISAGGLGAATIERITTRAGASRATLYAHFPGGRTDLIAEAYQTVGRDLIQAAERDAARHSEWIDRLCAYPRAMLELSSQRELGLFYNVSGPQLVGMQHRGTGSQRTLDAMIAGLLHAQESGEVSPQLDVEAIAALLVGAIREAGIDTSRDPSTAPRRLNAFRQLLEAIRT
ncbi:TetR/AcrR family transcriptional regulator [Arthrobacter crystallopoietes]|uniref:TetR/AcrR family transcriptional regulator n=1 Tax=Micrococcaceae TaxID=1268 RepID=UPI0021C7DCDE|nr:TetR/AcrR family transcriptional regulator [Arthrobacter sp. Marseille-P9274]